MASQNNIFNVIFVVAIAFFCMMAVVHASPIPNAEDVVAQPTDVDADDLAARDGRFYGLGGSQANAFATANAVSSGLGGGYPYGGGLEFASASAAASAGAGGMGYPYGK